MTAHGTTARGAPGAWRVALATERRRTRWQRELVSELLRPLESGAPLTEALADAAEEHESGTVARALLLLSEAIARGSSVSEALEDVGPLAGDALRATVRAGERSGRLAEALSSLERVLEEQESLTARRNDAWAEPLVTLGVAAVVLVVLLAGPLATLVGFSDPHGTGTAARVLARLAASPLLVGSSLAVLALGAFAVHRFAVRGRLGDRLPLAGPVRREGRRAIAIRSLALLVEADLSLPEALEIVAGTMPRDPLAAALRRAAGRVRAGEPLTETADETQDLGPLFAAVLAGGGRAVAPALSRLADFHEAELTRRGEAAVQLSQLVAVLVAGAVAGVIVVGTWGTYFESIGGFHP